MLLPRPIAWSASIAAVGSGLMLLLGLLFGLFTIGSLLLPDAGSDGSKILFACELVLLVLGTFGAISAIGLWRLKNWARVLLILQGVALVDVAALIFILYPLMSTSEPEQSPTVHAASTVAVLILSALLFSVGGVWIYALNGPGIRGPFHGKHLAPIARHRPRTISFLGYYLLFSGLLTIVFWLTPFNMFGIFVVGWKAFMLWLPLTALPLYAGLKCLGIKRSAYLPGVIYFSTSILSELLEYTIPGRPERKAAYNRWLDSVLNLTSEAKPSSGDDNSLLITLIGLLVFSIVPLVILACNRQYFLQPIPVNETEHSLQAAHSG
jgi:hypothetical protein